LRDKKGRACCQKRNKIWSTHTSGSVMTLSVLGSTAPTAV
jgi:hypothetical protein